MEPPMHKDTEDDWGGLNRWKQSVHVIVVYEVSINLNAHYRNGEDELCEAWDRLWAESDRLFIRAAAEAVEGVPREVVEVAGSLLWSWLRI